jgi:hypothetical protein
MSRPMPINCCRLCGSTNYHRLFARDDSGQLRPTGQYRCSGCQIQFAQTSQWRQGPLSWSAPGRQGP